MYIRMYMMCVYKVSMYHDEETSLPTDFFSLLVSKQRCSEFSSFFSLGSLRFRPLSMLFQHVRSRDDTEKEKKDGRKS